MKNTYVDGKTLARNGRKTATYYAASFLPHYRRVLFSNLLVFDLCAADPIQSENKRKEADNLRRLVVDQSSHKNIKTLPVCVGWLDFLSSACNPDIYG